jgi:hypothetical protein
MGKKPKVAVAGSKSVQGMLTTHGIFETLYFTKGPFG